MKKINVSLKEKNKEYPIFIGKELLKKVSILCNLSKYSRLFVVKDRNVPQDFLKKIQVGINIPFSVLEVESGDLRKNIESIIKIWEGLKNSGCDRKSVVINLGGGMVGDAGGFAAATYMRGTDFLQVPTTLLAQVDASIGGKVGINFLGIKNLIGSFQQPIGVIIDVETLATLPRREFISGFAEIIKHGLILDVEFFNLVTAKRPEDFSREELIEIITRSIEIKKCIIETDEKEENVRKLLNFGHTIGHAIESLSQETNNPLLHGEAVSIGMAFEAKISNLLDLLSDKENIKLQEAIKNAGLPVSITGFKSEEVLKKIQSDKKNEKGKVNWTLLKGIGKAIYNQKVDEAFIRKVI